MANLDSKVVPHFGSIPNFSSKRNNLSRQCSNFWHHIGNKTNFEGSSYSRRAVLYDI
jgi:hypothetical protein